MIKFITATLFAAALLTAGCDPSSPTPTVDAGGDTVDAGLVPPGPTPPANDAAPNTDPPTPPAPPKE